MLRSLSILLLLPSLAHAYAGPGMALSGMMAILGILGGILLLLVGSLWYPIKRLVVRFKQPKQTETPPDDML